MNRRLYLRIQTSAQSESDRDWTLPSKCGAGESKWLKAVNYPRDRAQTAHTNCPKPSLGVKQFAAPNFWPDSVEITQVRQNHQSTTATPSRLDTTSQSDDRAENGVLTAAVKMVSAKKHVPIVKKRMSNPLQHQPPTLREMDDDMELRAQEGIGY